MSILRASAPAPLCPAPTRARPLAAPLLALAAVLALGAPARAADVSLTDGRAAGPSELRGLDATGPRVTAWGKQPTPYAGNLADHQGRPTGSFEDGGRGRISGEILADENGFATIVVRDLKDTGATGKLIVTTGGAATRIDVARGANGNTRTLTFGGLLAGAWSEFKLLWAMAKPGKHDGFSVCRG